MMALKSIPSGSAWIAAGVTWIPSATMAIGAKMKKAMIVRILKRLMLSKPDVPAVR